MAINSPWQPRSVRVADPETPRQPLPHILIVDDDPDFLQLMEDALGRAPGRYGVTSVTTAAEALAKLQEQSFDLILVDYRLEGRDGLQLIEDLRSVAPALPVIMITGYPMLALRRAAEALDVAAFLIKPVAIPDLRRTVQLALSRR